MVSCCAACAQKRGGETTQLLGGTTQLLASAHHHQQQQQYEVHHHSQLQKHQPPPRAAYEECTTKLLADTTGASSSAPRMLELQPPAQHAAAHGLSRLSEPHAAWPGSAYQEPPGSPELLPLEALGTPAAGGGAGGTAAPGRAQSHTGAAAAAGRSSGHGMVIGSSQDKDESTLELNMTGGGGGMNGGQTGGLEDVTLDEFALPPEPQAMHRGVEQRPATMAFSGKEPVDVPCRNVPRTSAVMMCRLPS
jgi:hypothetical protein